MSEFSDKIVQAVWEEMHFYPSMEEALDASSKRVQNILTRKDGGTKGVKYMDLEEFGSLGFLQEANRLFFHPHGLALEITCDSPKDDNSYPNAVITGVWDYRDDPEGMIFGNLDGYGTSQEKIVNVGNERSRHWPVRAKLFGRNEKAIFATYADIEPPGFIYPEPEDKDGI